LVQTTISGAHLFNLVDLVIEFYQADT